MICPECGTEFFTNHNKKKYCKRECTQKALRRQQLEFRTNPFRTGDSNDFEPTIESSWFEDEQERRERLQRKQLNER